MDVYVLHVKPNGTTSAIGVYSTWELAQIEADNHAASVYQINTVLQITRIPDDAEIRCYGANGHHLVNYTIIRLTLDGDAKQPKAAY